MAEELSRTRPVRPTRAEVSPMTVLASTRISEGFQRVTLTGADDTLTRSFTPVGYDQWFRLFLPADRGTLSLPLGGIEGWYTRWQDLPEPERPTIRNYTVREARPSRTGDASGWELDVDFVVHLDAGSGLVEGVAARWALEARAGDAAGLLDQGRIYAPVTDRSTRSVALADETGVPAAEGIARSLQPGERASMVLEVAHADDRRPMPSRGAVDVVWLVRRPGEPVGRRALAALSEVALAPGDQLYAVGEASMVLAGRDIAQRSGLTKEQIDFCAYWRPGRRRAS